MSRELGDAAAFRPWHGAHRALPGRAHLAASRTQSAVLLLAYAALAWSAAFALLLALIARTPARPPRPHE